MHESASRARPARDRGLRWWKELLFVGGFYGVYTFIRDQFGSASVGATHARHNAERLIRLERALGLFHEQAVQHWFLAWPWLVRLMNLYYGSLHFVVPIAVLVVSFRRWPEDYRLWRNTLAATTGLALIGFSLFPLMPPRLLCDCAYGAGPGFHYGFVDTLVRYGGSWSFDSGAMKDVSNQYAAMPSLHVAWALWCTWVLVPRLRSTWAKALAVLYPAITILAVVVTGNHFVLDAVGGALTLGAGYLVGRAVTRVGERRRARRPLLVGSVPDPS
ncbi:MAG TPA: phosphatase PAP2 family protein [Acidimicrobiales bacterium]|nr:phosphatase PAP2 family protein [Acidimicrobiales bacterium]